MPVPFPGPKGGRGAQQGRGHVRWGQRRRWAVRSGGWNASSGKEGAGQSVHEKFRAGAGGWRFGFKQRHTNKGRAVRNIVAIML